MIQYNINIMKYNLREFVKLPSSWPPAREVGGVRAAVDDAISAGSGRSAGSAGSAPVFQKSPPVETKRYFSKKSRLPSRRNAICCFRTFKSEAPVETKR